jgi:hypothetical protein
MSLLPQKKKSAEEIAKIREDLGISGQLPIEKDLPMEDVDLAKAEVPTDSSLSPTEVAQDPSSDELAGAPSVARSPKVVRSLRKSEQAPLTVERPAVKPVESILPTLKHSDREIEELRRREALAAIGNSGQAVHPLLRSAHPVLILPGYLLVIAAAVSYEIYQLRMRVPIACILLAMVFPFIIFRRKPQSRHHAAFIVVIAIFVIVFGALHYFPQLRHGT